MGYHKKIITKGQFGEISKIVEEVEELQDAIDQNVKIMELCELSDIIGAVEGYIEKHHTEFTLQDVLIMSRLTRAAFKDGSRK